MYVAFRYEFSFAVGAVVAVVHDILMTIGIFAITGLGSSFSGGGVEARQFDATFVAALLTIVIVLFILGNGHEAQINFLLFEWKTTVRFAILVAVLLGVALDRVVDYGLKRRKKRKLKEKLKDID